MFCSAIKKQDGLANTSCIFNILSLSSSEEKFGWVFNSTILQSSLVSNVLLPTLLSCSEFLWRECWLKKIFYQKKFLIFLKSQNFKWATLKSFYIQIVISFFHWAFKDKKPSYHHLNTYFFFYILIMGSRGGEHVKKKKIIMYLQRKTNDTQEKQNAFERFSILSKFQKFS